MVSMVELIARVRDKSGPLSRDEIQFIVSGFTDGSIPDYQVSALLMAIVLNGVTPQETADLTLCMTRSGEVPMHPAHSCCAPKMRRIIARADRRPIRRAGCKS